MKCKRLLFLVALSFFLGVLVVFWGCQEGGGPTAPFFKVWTIETIYSATGLSEAGDPLTVFAGQANTVCARIFRIDEKGDTVWIPTDETVYFTVDAQVSQGGAVQDQILADETGVNPSEPGLACFSFVLPESTVALSVTVKVIGYAEYTKSQDFVVYSAVDQGQLSLYGEANEVVVGSGQVKFWAVAKTSFGSPVQNELVCFYSADRTMGVFSDSCLFTNSAGACTTYFVIGTKAGIDTICASDTRGNTVCGVIIVDPEVANTCSLAADRYHIYRCGFGAYDQTDIYAYIWDRYWNPVKSGTKVVFRIESFTYEDSCGNPVEDNCYPCPGLEPEHPVLGRWVSDTVLVQRGFAADGTTEVAFATVKLKAGRVPGVVSVSVEVCDGSGTTAEIPQINISSGQPHYISLSARVPGSSTWEAGDPSLGYYSAPIDYAMWGACTQDSMPLEVMAVVSDEFHNPIPNVSVWFTTTSGVVGGWPGAPSVAVTTDSMGICQTYWFSSDRRELDSCVVMLKAYCDEVDVGDSLFFYLRYPTGDLCCDPCENIHFEYATVTPETIDGSGLDSATIEVKLNYNNIPLPNYEVFFRAGYGGLSAHVDTTDQSGVASVKYAAVNPSENVISDVVRIISGDYCETTSVVVYIRPVSVALNVSLIADEYNPSIGGELVNLYGYVLDQYGDPVHIPLPLEWFSTADTFPSMGALVSASSFTDTLGTFGATFQTGTEAGVVTITVVVASTGTASVVLNVLGGVVTLVADDYDPSVGGEIVHLSGAVRNVLGEPITTPMPISWQLLLPDGSIAPATMGMLDSLSYYSDTLGNFGGVYVTGTEVGTVLVVADVAGVGSDTVRITVHSGPPAAIDLSVSPAVDTVGGLVPDTVYGCITDSFGNPVEYSGVVELWLAYDPAGDSVCYPCPFGSVEPSSVVPDSLGCFTALFTPGTMSGVVWIHAQADSAHGAASIIIYPQLARSCSIAVSRQHIRTCGNAPYQTLVTAFIFDQFGNPVSDMTPVMFAIDTFTYMDACTVWDDSCLAPCPRLVPSHPTMGYLFSDTVYTVDGATQVTLKAGTLPGVVRVAAYVLDGSGEMATSEMINISSGQVQLLSLSARRRSNIDDETGNPCLSVPPYTCEYCSWDYNWWSGDPSMNGYAPQLNLPNAWNMDGDTCNGLWIQLRVSATDSFGNPIPNATIHFSCDEGRVGGYPSGLADSIALTDSFGLAYSYWYAADPRIDGQVWIRALCADAGVGDSLYFYMLDTLGIPPFDTVVHNLIYVVPDTVFGDGLSTADIMVRITRNGNPVPNYPVYFFADSGSIVSPVFTDSIGYARTTYYSGTNHHMTPPVITTDRITVVAGVDTSYFNIYLLPVDPILPYVAYVLLDLEPDEVTVGDTAVLVGLVLDGYGFPVRLPVPVNFALHQNGLPAPLGMGMISPAYTYTSTNPESLGYFRAVFRSGTQAGELWIVVQVEDVLDSILVSINGGAPQSITVVPEDSLLEADGRSSMTVTAYVTDAYGNPVEGEVVNFSTTLGQVAPSSAVTDESGAATTILTSGLETGIATITATCGDQSGTATVEFVAATVHFIILHVDPNRLVADGTSVATVTADVRDQYGQPIADGTIVSFRCLDSLGNPVGSIDTISTTTGGVATANLTAPTVACDAWVFATAMGHTDSAQVSFTPGEVFYLTVDAYPDSIPADGMSQSTVVARAFDQFGNPVGLGQRIDFSTDLGNLVYDYSFTNDTGVAEVPLVSARETGVAHITASSASAEANTEVVFTPVTAAMVIVTADTISLPADGVSSTTIRATALDSTGAAVPDGTPIFFETDLGLVIPGVAYTDSGEASVALRAPTTPGLATVIADAGGGVEGTTYVQFVADVPAQIIISASPSVLPADGETTAAITGTVYDANGNHVGAGISVSLATNLGFVDTVAFTDSTGSFSATFQAGITPGTAVIVATCGDAVGQTMISLVPTDVGVVYILVDPNELVADSRSEATVTGRVTNTIGNPIADGTPVRLEVHCSDTLGCEGYGEVMPVTAHTDSGNFSATFVAGTKIGRVWIVASVDTISDSVFVDLVPGEADSIALSASPTSIPADSFSTSTITATLYDRFGNRLGSGATVNFSTTLGEISPTSTTTNSSGEATATLRSGRVPGVALVRASSGSAVNETEVVFTQTGGAIVVVTASPGQIVADGMSTTMIQAQVSDSLGNPISDGTPVMFVQVVDTAAGEDTLGLLVPSVGFTSGGVAAVQFRSRTKTGRATVRACVDSVHCGETFVDLVAGPADSIYLVAADTALPADGTSITDITASVFDRFGNAVENGRMVSFTTTLGQLYPSSAPTNSSGQATVMLTSATTPGVARITAQCEDAYASVDVNFGMTPPVYLSVTANPRYLVADGISTSTVTAHLINSVGGPVLDGTMVVFHSVDASGAPFGDIDTVATTTNGEASVELVAPTRTGVAYVSATYYGESDTLSDTVTVTFTAGDPAEVQVWVSPGTLYANDTLSARVTIVVTDVFGNLVDPGYTVSISTDNGEVFPTTGYTGDTIVCTYYPGELVGRAVITASCGGLNGVAVVELVSQAVANLAVYADSAYLTANGLSTTPVHIVAQDSMGHPVPDNTPVYVTTSAGAVFPGVTYTSGGEATVTLRSGTHAGDTAVVLVVAGAVSGTLRVPFVAGPPAIVTVVPQRTNISADGEDTTLVRAYITDLQGNWVSEGLLVSFATTLGEIDSLDVTHSIGGDTTGYAEAMFHAGIEPGVALVTVTCGDAVGTGRITLSPTNVGEVAIFADPDIIVADGHQTSNIHGYVRNVLGNPIAEGTEVRLGVTPDSLGNISPATVYTDSGNFSATFTAATYVGTVWVWMEVGSVRDSVAIELVPGAPHTIVMTPTFGTIPADSSTVDTIGVVVYDRYGNRVRGGITVEFTTSLGELFPTSNETNASGSTYVFLRSGHETGVARVVGRADSARGECSIVITETQPTTVYLTVDPQTLMADGYSTASLTATVLDTSGNLISDGTPVIFTLVDESFGVTVPGISYTHSGVATSTFRASVRKGRAAIVAMTDTAHTDTVYLTLTAGPPATINLTANPDTLSANGMDRSDITAVVYDEWGNPVDAGQTVNFNSTLGTILYSTLLTDDSGTARTVLQAGSVPGECQVSAQCGGVYDVTSVYFRPSQISTIVLSADPAELVADGVSSSAIIAQAFDASGSPVTDNTRIYFWVRPASSGTVISPRFTSGGQAATSFVVGTSVDSGYVWVFAGDTLPPATTVMDSVRILLRPGEPAYVVVWMDSAHAPAGTLYADGNDGAWIYARVYDAYGNHVLGGNTVSFSTTMGRFSPTSSMTDTSGLARAFLQAGLETGTATVTVTCGSAMGFLGVEMIETRIEGILLTTDKPVLRADGVDMATVTATVYAPGGTPVSDGAIVHFFAESAWVHLLPEETYTDSGEAQSTVRADTIARSAVRVFAYATLGGDTSDTAALTFRLDPGDPARMVISPSPSDSARIPADGASSVTIDVWVYDQYSNPIRAGSTVRFSTTLGTITDVSFTDMSGHASALLTAGTETGNAVVTITCGDITGFTQVTFYELLTAELIMTISPIQLIADGVSSATITVNAYDSAGFPVSDGSRIVLTQHDTTGGFVQGVITPHIAYTTDGVITSTLTAPVKVGKGRIYAYADTVGSAIVDSFDVQYVAGPPAVIRFDTTGFGSFMADGRFYPVPVVVKDAYGNPVEVGTEVTFSTTLGEIQSPAVVANDTGGAVTYIMSHETGPAVITARSGDAIATAHCSFSEIEGNWISVIANPYIITADGVSQSVITATLMDTSTGMFIPVSDGVPVQFRVSGPGILASSIAFTENGQASVTFTAGTRSDTTTIYAIGPVIPPGDTLKDSVKVYLAPGPPAVVEFISSYLHDLPANGTDTMQVWVRVLDAFGNGVQRGTPVSFSTNLGSITPNSAVDDSGYAWAILTASSTPGVATLSATCQGATGYATIAMQQLVADSIILAVYPREIVADGASTSDLTAVVFDSTGLPVSDGTIVRFSASRGLTNPAIAYTSGGIATSQLISAVSPDTVVIAAISGAVADTDTVILVPGPPARMSIWATPDSMLVANGNDSLRIWVQVLDDYGNPVRAGQPVSFSTTIGIITPNAYTDENGQASVILTSEYEVGWAQVTATCGGATASMLVQFVPDSVGQVILSVNPIELVADGTATANVSVTVLDVNSHPIADGTPVLFSGLSLGLVDPPIVTTTGGSASATLVAFTIVGQDTLVASCGDVADSVAVTFVAGPPANIVLTPNQIFLISDGLDTTSVIATVTDAAGNPVKDGTLVNFSVTPSEMGHVWEVGVTSSGGQCRTVFRAGTQPGVVAVNATSGSATGTCIIELVPPSVESIELSIADHYLPGDGLSSTQVTAMVFDTLGLPAPDGTGVHFDITAGSVPANLFPAWAQTSDGVATVQLIAPTAVGVCSVYAYIDTGGAVSVMSDTEVVYFEGGEPQVILFSPTSLTLPADGATDTTCTLWVLDRYGNPVGAQPVNMSLDLGRVTPSVVVTDTSGRGTFQVVSSRNIGDGVVQAIAGSAEGYMNVHYEPVPVDTILLFATPSILPADGTSQSTITAIVLDSLGRLVSNGIGVFFYTTDGYITPYDTTADGQAQAILTAIDTASVVTVTAVCEPETATIQVTFTPGVPDTVLVHFSQGIDTVGSSTIDSIYGYVLDTLGNPVGEGSLVELWLSTDASGLDTCGAGGEPCSLGTIADVTVLTDPSGRFSTQFTPGTKAGVIWVQAKSGNAFGRDYMILDPEIAHTESIDVDRNHIYVRGSGNIDQAVLTAYIYDRYGNPVKDSTKVIFWCTNYPGGADPDRQPSLEPPHPTLGQLWSDTVYTLSGRANVTVRAGKASGVVIVRSAVLDGSGIVSEAPRITIASGLPYYISVSRTDCNVPGWLVDGLSDTIMAIVSDSMENPCPNVAVYFTCDEGIVTGSATTDSNGIAYATWYSADPRDDGVVWVHARTRGDSSASCNGEAGWVCDSVSLFNSGPATNLSITVTPGSVNADGTSTADVVVTATDVNGNPVVDETEVTLEVNIGSITSPVMTYNECYGTRADATYTSAVVDVDQNCGSPQVATATITARADFATATATVNLMGGDCSSDNSSMTAPGTVPMGGDFAVVVTVRDIWGNPICGESVLLTSALGAAIAPPNPATTNSSGQASFMVTAITDTVSRTDLLTASFGACAVWQTVSYTLGLLRPAPDADDTTAGAIVPQIDTTAARREELLRFDER